MKNTQGASNDPCPGMHSEPCQHLGLPLAYTTQGTPKAQSHKSQLRGCAVCMPSVNSTTSLWSKPELARLKKTCLLRGLHSACGWGAWNVAYTPLRGGKMQSVFSQVGNSGVWNNCCGSQSPVYPGELGRGGGPGPHFPLEHP